MLCLIAIVVTTAPAIARDEADLGPGVGLTVYNQNFAIVRERREMQLPEGVGSVQFADVAATIVPQTVQFRSLRPGGAEVLEQNYEFDLVSADKLLAKYLDRKISIVDRDGGLVEGTLLASDAGQLVLKTGQGVELIARGKQIKDIRFSSLPKGLLVRPTLIWKVRAAKRGKHLVKVAYRANNMTWRVDYRAVASADMKTLDLSGWVTITNQTGTTFRDAGIKLMAGDVHVVSEASFGRGLAAAPMERLQMKSRAEGFQEKSFAEYHLYTLGHTTTVANQQTKQIELINVAGIPVERKYLYQASRGNRVAVILEFKNSKKLHQGLGVPLPKGPVRVFRRGADGDVEFIGQNNLDHTPKDEPVKVRIGDAFGLTVERTQLSNRGGGRLRWNEQSWRIRLRNHTERAVTITVRELLRSGVNWKILQQSQDFEAVDFQTLDFPVPVPAHAEREVTYTVRYSW